MSKIEILSVEPDDFDSIINLLNHYGLVIQDIDLNKQIFIKLTQNSEILGIGAVELYKPYGLIRSLAVNPDKTKLGLARELVSSLELIGSSNNIKQLYLLTETAEPFFTKLGYTSIDRETTPEAIKLTNQFNTLCPASAAVMVKSIIPSI